FADRRTAMTHDHLDVWRDGGRPTAVGDELELVAGGRGGVDVGGVRTHQAGSMELLDGRAVNPGDAHPDVDGDPNAHVASQSPILLDDLAPGDPRPPDRQGEREQVVLGP